MFKNYFKTALRSLLRHKLFSGLNILGLAIGMCVSLLIFLWVQDELSYDRFNKNADAIYRITLKAGSLEAATSPLGLGPALHEELPEVEAATRFLLSDEKVLAYGDRRFKEAAIGYADSNFLRMFNYPLVKGSSGEALSRKDEILLTESTAKKYFGNDDPIGKTMRLDNQSSYVVTGVLKDVPRNSHLRFDALLPMSIMEEHERKSNSYWGNFIYYTFLKLQETAANDPTMLHRLEQRMPAVFKSHQTGMDPLFFLQRLTDIHLHSHLLLDVAGQGDILYVRIFSWVALFIILIACINFMNLSTAISGTRAKEVGLRKTIGALRHQLIAQFLGESLLLAFIALSVGLGLARLLLPLFNELTGKTMGMQFLSFSHIAGAMGIAAAVGLLAGVYPSLVLSAFQPVKVLKGLKVLHPGRSYFRNGLVVLQFTIAIVLIAGTVVVYQQLQFIRHRDIGYNKDNLLYIPIPQLGDMQKNARTIDDAMSRYPGIVNHTIVSDLPTDLTSGDLDVQWDGKDIKQQTVFTLMGGDENMVATFGMHLIAGRYFSKNFAGDENNYVVNETALKVMGMDPASALGKKIKYSGREGNIIGVLKDFNFKPVHQPVAPLLLMKGWSRGYLYELVRTTPANVETILPLMQKTFNAVFEGYPFSYGFVDQDLSRLYTTEQRMGRLANIFSILSILVSCLGLFGLSAYTTQRRFKEIGVRKVLGASVPGIVQLLAREFLGPIVIAALIAFPLAGWIMNNWLSAFAYRISIHWWVFAVSGIAALLIALVTVAFQAVKAALVNPVLSLRAE